MKRISVLKKSSKNQPERFYPDYQSSILRSPKLDLIDFTKKAKENAAFWVSGPKNR